MRFHQRSETFSSPILCSLLCYHYKFCLIMFSVIMKTCFHFRGSLEEMTVAIPGIDLIIMFIQGGERSTEKYFMKDFWLHVWMPSAPPLFIGHPANFRKSFVLLPRTEITNNSIQTHSDITSPLNSQFQPWRHSKTPQKFHPPLNLAVLTTDTKELAGVFNRVSCFLYLSWVCI